MVIRNGNNMHLWKADAYGCSCGKHRNKIKLLEDRPIHHRLKFVYIFGYL